MKCWKCLNLASPARDKYSCLCRNFCFHEVQIPALLFIYFQPVLEALFRLFRPFFPLGQLNIPDQLRQTANHQSSFGTKNNSDSFSKKKIDKNRDHFQAPFDLQSKNSSNSASSALLLLSSESLFFKSFNFLAFKSLIASCLSRNFSTFAKQFL